MIIDQNAVLEISINAYEFATIICDRFIYQIYITFPGSKNDYNEEITHITLHCGTSHSTKICNIDLIL